MTRQWLPTRLRSDAGPVFPRSTMGRCRAADLAPEAAASFSPDSLFGVSDDGLWLDFSAGTVFEDDAKTTPATDDADPLGAAADRQGNYDATQSTAGSRPLLQLAEVAGGPAAQFDGTDDKFVFADTGIVGPMTLALSFKTPASIAPGIDRRMFCADSGAAGDCFAIGFNASGTDGIWLFQANTVQIVVDLADLSAATWYLLTLVWTSGTSTTAYLDGVEKYTRTHSAPITSYPMNLGGKLLSAFGNNWNSFFREVFWIDRAIDADERASLTTYMLANIGK